MGCRTVHVCFWDSYQFILITLREKAYYTSTSVVVKDPKWHRMSESTVGKWVWVTLHCPVVLDPCPPESLALVESEDNCTLTWDTMPYAESYEAFIKSSDSSEILCNTTGSSCTFQCLCGYTFLMSVFAVNQAGRSPQGPVLNHTNCK